VFAVVRDFGLAKDRLGSLASVGRRARVSLSINTDMSGRCHFRPDVPGSDICTAANHAGVGRTKELGDEEKDGT
jgi:hypothetical protein